jgi:TIR domain
VIVAHIFISYASPDRPVADEVLGWLRAAGHEAFLDDDLRDGIGVGEDGEQRLHRELRQADAVIGVSLSTTLTDAFAVGLSSPLLRVALQVFVDRRLPLSDTDDDGQVWLTVAHEALLTGWRLLDTAIADITVALRTARSSGTSGRGLGQRRPARALPLGHYLWDDKRFTTTLTALVRLGLVHRRQR